MNSDTVNRPTRTTWLRAIAAVSLLVSFFLASGTAWAAPPPVKHAPGLTVQLVHSQYGTSPQGIHQQPATQRPAADLWCLGVTLTVTNDRTQHYVYVKLGVNNLSCPSNVAALQWSYWSALTCGGTISGNPSNNGEVQLLPQGQFYTVADDTWFIICSNGFGYPVQYSLVVYAQAEGQLTNVIGDFAFGEQTSGNQNFI